MTFEEAKIQVLIEEHSRMPLDHHNLPTAAKDCPLCKKATMTTEEKKCDHVMLMTCDHKNFRCDSCCKKCTPPETGREWEKDFDSRFDYSIIESVIRDMGDKATWLDMKKGIKAFIRSIESSALAKGEKIGREKTINEIWNKGVDGERYDPRKSMSYLERLMNALKG